MDDAIYEAKLANAMLRFDSSDTKIHLQNDGALVEEHSDECTVHEVPPRVWALSI
ncbi:hypothetical protein FF011L_05410 [Roseimaritima multifibrata]|uniref:Uncharacterized protein n=1 Tax=Roseimaritima multifibrata TaxID=1930274 RepID=A0A517MAA3_9BACT|nr:hypothetical protein FF011L_05410 [Roseimaritima multifibrata]